MALTDLELRTAKPKDKPYRLPDGTAGLYLWIEPSGAKYWRRDYRFGGKRKTASFGVYLPADAGERAKPATTVVQARAAALMHRAKVADGLDPAVEKAGEVARAAIEARAAMAQAKAAAEAAREARERSKVERRANRLTVTAVADEWFRAEEAGWTVSYAHHTRQSINDYIHPKIGAKPIADVTTGDVLEVLSAVLADGKAETARRVSMRLGMIWDYAILKGYTVADVVRPTSRAFAKLRKNALKAKPKKNFPALPKAALPQFLKAMRGYTGDDVTRLALRLLALTFTRTTELRMANWSEFDLDGDKPTWTIPVIRMKIKMRGDMQAEPHVVPLSRQAVETLRMLRKITESNPLVFPQSRKKEKPISENAILFAIYALGYKDKMTGHGFRAVASTLLHESGWPHGAIEAQLAHEKADATSAAYDRAEYIDTRHAMMQAYADMLDSLEFGMLAAVVPIRQTA
jgi:integrase